MIKPFHPADIVQITAEGHKWRGALAIVDEVKGWGVLAHVPCIATGTLDGIYLRIKNGEIELCGAARLAPPETIKARAQSIETANNLSAEKSRK